MKLAVAPFEQEFVGSLDNPSFLHNTNTVGVSMVESRWAITMVVRIRFSIACWTSTSTRNREEVASSRMRMGESLTGHGQSRAVSDCLKFDAFPDQSVMSVSWL